MSIIETINDVNNTFLSRRELTCNFTGLGGKLKKFEAVDMITKEFKLDGKIVIPILMKNQVGRSSMTGTFYVYEDEALAKKHVNPTIFARMEKAKAKDAEAQASEETKEAESSDKTEDSEEKPEATEAKDDKQSDEKKEDKTE